MKRYLLIVIFLIGLFSNPYLINKAYSQTTLKTDNWLIWLPMYFASTGFFGVPIILYPITYERELKHLTSVSVSLGFIYHHPTGTHRYSPDEKYYGVAALTSFRKYFETNDAFFKGIYVGVRNTFMRVFNQR